MELTQLHVVMPVIWKKEPELEAFLAVTSLIFLLCYLKDVLSIQGGPKKEETHIWRPFEKFPGGN